MNKLPQLLNGPRSLRSKLTAVLLASTFIPLALVGAISYYTIYSILDHKIEDGIRGNLSRTKQSIEASIDQLRFLSQQLSLDGSVGQNLSTYLTTADLYEKKVMRDRVVDELNLITFSNPNLGMVCYYLPASRRTLFGSFCPTGMLDVGELPVFNRQSSFVFYGPYLARNGLEGQIMAVSRTIETESGALTIYIETKIQNFFFGGDKPNSESLLVVDDNGIIAHSDSASFKAGTPYSTSAGREDAYLFMEASDQGWSLVSVMPKSYYNREINEWLLRFFLLGVSSLGVSLLLAWTVWRTVYRPLRSLNREIMMIAKNHFLGPIRFTGVKEFDFLLMRFQDMRARIRELLREVRDKEKRKASLEVEKLMHQINPHFTHNTLDTIRWLARMEGHDEIDRLVSTLNKVLYYNLGKGNAATIKDEIAALGHYVTLQQIRYNFHFDVRIDADDDVRDASIPRFILQPLVENALYHGGMEDDGVIRVTIGREEERIAIRVSDNGAGMDEATVARLMDLDGASAQGGSARSGMGIGINYARRMIDFQFGERADFTIESAPGRGTTILIRIPYERKESDNDERPDRG